MDGSSDLVESSYGAKAPRGYRKQLSNYLLSKCLLSAISHQEVRERSFIAVSLYFGLSLAMAIHT
jgi:hypothetical protein